MGKKFLVWLDILGFEQLPKEIANSKRIDERVVREHFIHVINQTIEAIEEEAKTLGKNYGGRDEWILAVDSLDLVFRIISEITTHNTGYENYEKIPLEIAVGVGE